MTRSSCLLAAALLCTAPAARPADFDTLQLLRELAQVREGHATFVETKYLRLLDQPVRSSGTLAFQAPARIEKFTLEPSPERLVLDGDALSIERDGRTMRIDLRRHVAALSFVEAIRGVLLGDAELLERGYRIELRGDAQDWHLLLVPRDADLAAVIREIRVGGAAGQVRSIEYRQPDGDRSVMQIEPAAPGGKP